MESYNTFNDLSNRVCIPKKTGDLNLSDFNMIAGINEYKILTKHIQCKWGCKLMVENVMQVKFGIMINIGMSVGIWKDIMCAKKIILGILQHVLVGMANI